VLPHPILERLRRLTVLGFDAGLSAIQCLLGCPFLGNMRALSLGSFLLNVECIRALVVSSLLRRLTHLDLSFVGDDEVRVLADTPNCVGLLELSVHGGNLSDIGVCYVAGLPHLEHLQVLRLIGDRIGDEGAFAVAGSPRFDRLELLDYQGGQVTDAGKDALRKRFGKRVYLGGHPDW
jgi:hypothetical protein